MSEFMSTQQVCDLLEIDHTTLKYHRERGRIKAERFGSGPRSAYVYRHADAVAFALARQEAKSADPRRAAEPEPIEDPAAGYGEGTRHGARRLEDLDDRDTLDAILGRDQPKPKASVSVDVVNRAKARKDWPKW